MKLFKREKYLSRIRGFYDADDLIKVITGIRRCGKSCVMQTIANELKLKGVDDKNIIFIDLDKRGFKNVRTGDQLESLIEAKTQADGLKYLFIDEIQNVSGFEEVINGFRTEGGYSIFITGSNSYLLSGELVTKLTGRHIEFELFPLSFDEYVEMKAFYGKNVPSDRLECLNQYLMEGGFPRTIFIDNFEDKRTYVKSVIDDILGKDIRQRIKIRDLNTFEKIRNYIINNFGATTNHKSLFDALKGTGISSSRTTIARYIQALIDAKILYPCDRFDMKSKQSLKGDKKYYLADLSFYYALNTDNRIHYGPALENLIYIYARSQKYHVSVGRIGKLECDFILRDQAMNYSYIQVAYTILESKKTEDREYTPLEMIQDNYSKYVMTTDAFLQKRNGIKHVNLIDFMTQAALF